MPRGSVSPGSVAASFCLYSCLLIYISSRQGSNEYGQLGQGGAVPMSNTPAAVLCEDPAVTLLFSKIACGGMHSAAIDLTGHVWCWGRADSGQTGSGKWVFSHFPGLAYPKKIENVSGIIDVCCGGFHTTVLAENGRAMAMGKEDFGVLGTGIANSKQMKQGTETLTDIAALTDEKIVGISCGGWHSMFWTEDGKLYSCGKGEYGRLGLGNEENIPSPTLVTFEDPSVRVQSASCGGSHSLILTTDGRVFAVGRSDDGRLGLGSDLKPKIMTPYLVTPDTNVAFTVVQVVAGGAHSLVLVQHAGDVASTINPYPFIST